VRFLLDQDVDARIRRIFTNRGHECWTAADANLSAASDDELTVYATDKRAVLVTHDRRFSQRRRRAVIGKHLQLRCPEEEAGLLLARHFDRVIETLQGPEHVLVQLSERGMETFTRWDPGQGRD
jgi:predicted nuclease of predicted toxin-antitoxin system